MWRKIIVNQFKIRAIITLLIVTSLAAGVFWSAAAQETEPRRASTSGSLTEFQAGEVLVKFKDGLTTNAAESVMDQYNATRIRFLYSGDVELWQAPQGRELAIIQGLNAEPNVEYAEPNYRYHAFDTTPNDTHFNKQWGHTRIKSPAAWDITTGSAGITIAIIDTGIDEGHPDLASKIVAGYDFVGGDSNPHDLNGHGTHCAGIAAAVTNNAQGGAGMDWNARIMPVRVLNEEGSGWNSDITDGIYWAYQHGADVLSLSLGGISYSQSMQNAVNAAHAAGSLVVAAMGNCRIGCRIGGHDYVNPTSYPAAYNNVMAVAATGPSDSYASYSQYGPHCDIAAPGGDMGYYHDPAGIYSTMPTYDVYMTTSASYYKNYDYVNGTSQATPYVAGLAALIRAADPALTPHQVQTLIQTTADDLGSAGWDQTYGHGRINAYAALQAYAVPDAPTLYSISNPDGNGDYFVDWSSVAEAAGYTLQEDDNASFNSPTTRYTGANSQYQIAGQGAGIWHYRVRASNSAGNSPWSSAQSVGVVPAAPVLAPISNSSHADAYQTSWSAVPGAYGYTLEEDDNGSFSSPVTRYAGTALQYNVTGQPGGDWYYRVHAYNAAGDSLWSNTRATTVDPAALDSPILNPIDNADGDGDYLVDWSEVVSATSYALEESRDPYFSDPAVVYTGTATQTLVVNQPGGTWRYRVRALGPAGKSPWSNQPSVVVISYVFLPLISKNYTPPLSGGPIFNGDFESGATDWAEYSTHGWPLIINSGFPDSIAPHSESWAVWLGGDYDDTSYIQQQVTIPPGEPYLGYWRWIASEDVCGYDFGKVLINGTAVDSYDLCDSTSTGGWVKRVVNLGAYTGQPVSLKIQAKTDGSLNSNLFVDDVAFQSSAAAGPSAAHPPEIEAAAPKTN